MPSDRRRSINLRGLVVILVAAGGLLLSGTSSALGIDADLLHPTEAAELIEQALPEAVAPSEPQKTNEGTSVEPTVVADGESFESRGTGADSEIFKDPEQGYELETQGGTLAVKPTDTASTATDGEQVNGDAVVHAGTGKDSDTVVRPTAEGVETFTSLRSEEAGEQHSWTVDLDGDQELRETDNGAVEIIDPTPTHEPAGQQPAAETPDQADLHAAQAAGEVSSDAELPDPDAQEKSDQVAAQAGPADPADPALGEVPAPPEQPGEPADAPADEADGGVASINEALEQAEADAQERVSEETQELDAEQAERNGEIREEIEDSKTAAEDAPVVVATVKPAWAKDADGESVPTELSVEGDTVTMTVDHRDGDYSYPIVADPWVVVVDWELRWALRPVYEWQWRYSHKNAAWHHVGHWYTAALIDHYYNYGWGPSRNWWGWHNVQLPAGWLTMPYWWWGPMYHLEWFPVHTWQLVLARWEPYLQVVVNVNAWWEDDPEELDTDGDGEQDVGPWWEDGHRPPGESADTGYENPDDSAHAAWGFALPPIVLGCAKLCPKLKDAPRWVRGVKRKPRPKIPKARVKAYQPFKNQALNDVLKGKPGASLARRLGGHPFSASGWEAHHIVAWGARAAAPAQRILHRCGIHPNAQKNGVYLPRNGEALRRSDRAPHGPIHTNHYYRNVNNMLTFAMATGGCRSVELTLDALEVMLRRNAMPH